MGDREHAPLGRAISLADRTKSHIELTRFGSLEETK